MEFLNTLKPGENTDDKKQETQNRHKNIINGSFEMMPTEERIEKAHIAGWMLLCTGGIIDFVAILNIGKLRKHNKVS